jgi:hypothetical protein
MRLLSYGRNIAGALIPLCRPLISVCITFGRAW